ncbi:Mn2+-dependent serine/threonine protein kinase [mine drainage metagenome]|uniref:non-specific serine/threonine protein kinase n=1 Tax=mine drainage metagenome TaxID=410659 RepID=T0ZQM1_9ZZZZ
MVNAFLNYMKISEGAEADVYLGRIAGRKAVVKYRRPKPYLVKRLEERLRVQRTRREARILSKAYENGISVPAPLLCGRYSIYMEFVEGRILSSMASIPTILLPKIGKVLAELHNMEIIHGDYTTANLLADGSSIHAIDFGLAAQSDSEEEKALDLLLLKRSLENSEFKKALSSYSKYSNNYIETTKLLKEIELRGRYQTRTLLTNKSEA